MNKRPLEWIILLARGNNVILNRIKTLLKNESDGKATLKSN